MADEQFREFGWDDEISNEGMDFTLLPEGDYDFTIAKVERARHAGSAKIPPCNMAKVTFTIWGAEDKIEITENYFLCNKFEWKLSALFLATGLKKHGEPLKMQWGLITGAKGKCHVFIEKYTKTDGSEGQSNKIKKLYAYDEAPNIATVQPVNQQTQYNAAPQYQPTPQQYQQPAPGMYQQPMQPQYTQPTQPAQTYQQPATGGWTPGNF